MQFEVRSILFAASFPISCVILLETFQSAKFASRYITLTNQTMLRLSPCHHSQVTTPGPGRVFIVFTKEKSSYYHREFPIWHDMFLYLHLTSGSVATSHTLGV